MAEPPGQMTMPTHKAPAASAVSARALGRLNKERACPQCGGTGSVWVVCPDAGAIRLSCACARTHAASHISLLDAGLATAVVACCGVAYLLL